TAASRQVNAKHRPDSSREPPSRVGRRLSLNSRSRSPTASSPTSNNQLPTPAYTNNLTGSGRLLQPVPVRTQTGRVAGDVGPALPDSLPDLRLRDDGEVSELQQCRGA